MIVINIYIRLIYVFTMNRLFIILMMFFNSYAFSQIDANSLMGLPRASTAERNAITGVSLGSLVYDSTLNRVFQYTNSGWLELQTERNVYLGVFEITGATTAASPLEIIDVPFRPTQVSFVAHANVDALNQNQDNGVGNNNTGIANAFGSMNGFARENTDNSITQQTIYIGGSGNSINDISRSSSSNHCIGVRYSNQNGNQVGLIRASLDGFTNVGFNLVVTYANGTPAAERLVVLFTAYR